MHLWRICDRGGNFNEIPKCLSHSGRPLPPRARVGPAFFLAWRISMTSGPQGDAGRPKKARWSAFFRPAANLPGAAPAAASATVAGGVRGNPAESPARTEGCGGLLATAAAAPRLSVTFCRVRRLRPPHSSPGERERVRGSRRGIVQVLGGEQVREGELQARVRELQEVQGGGARGHKGRARGRALGAISCIVARRLGAWRRACRPRRAPRPWPSRG